MDMAFGPSICFTNGYLTLCLLFLSSGYLESCRTIVGAAKTIAEKIKSEIPELYILGNPPASVVAFSSQHPDVKIYEVGDAMSEKGWHLNALNDPAALHIACTVSTTLLTSSPKFSADVLTFAIFNSLAVDGVSC